MNLTMIRAKVNSERVAELEAATKEWFAAVEDAQPQGVRYASCKLADGETFAVILALDDGSENPLAAVPGFDQFQAGVQDCLAEPPTVEQATVVGSYRLF